MVEKEQARAAAEEKEIQVEREDADKRIKKLKAKLYNKFGNSINLDEWVWPIITLSIYMFHIVMKLFLLRKVFWW